jgi:transposase
MSGSLVLGSKYIEPAHFSRSTNVTATRKDKLSTQSKALYFSFELGEGTWKLAFTVGIGQKPRQRTMPARDLPRLGQEILKAKKRFGLPPDAPVHSCYEAGRDGFWLHRHLLCQGINNIVVDSASIEVNRRQRRAKTDRLDAVSLVGMLLRYHNGERKVWSVVRVPGVADEDARQLHRELEALKDERTSHVNRIKGLLASQGLQSPEVNKGFADWLKEARLWDGTAVPKELQQRLLRELERWQLLNRQILDQEGERRRRIRCDDTPHVNKVRALLNLWGIGISGAWLIVYEMLAWRDFQNRKQVGASTGLTPTPYQSGTSHREQGISKAGNRRMRRMLTELAWCWLRWQPDSELSRWFMYRFGLGKRNRKRGIIALARKLIIALWRYVEFGEVPKGARLADWRKKVKGCTKAEE